MSDNMIYAALDAEAVALAEARRTYRLYRRVEYRLCTRVGVPRATAALDRLYAVAAAADDRRRAASALVDALDRLAAVAMPPLGKIGRMVEVGCDDANYDDVRAAVLRGDMDSGHSGSFS